MRLSQWMLLSLLCIISVGSAVAKPFKTRPSQTHDGRRTRAGTRRMRLLQKILQTVSPQDRQILLEANMSKRGHAADASDNYVPIIDVGVEPVPLNLPEIECPEAEDGIKLFACPTPDVFGVYRCLDDHALCDNKLHCPNGEDEDRTVCMFHKMILNYFQMMMGAIEEARDEEENMVGRQGKNRWG